MNKIYVLLLFGMLLIPCVAAEEVVFVHITDVHLCDADFAESYYGAGADVDPPAFFGETIAEIGPINPDFVVCTGDLVAAEWSCSCRYGNGCLRPRVAGVKL